MQVDNAIILAAGTSSRFAPLSYERPKALIKVKGEILIERQIRQLKEAGIDEIVVVTGYMAEKFDYLKEKFGVILVNNPEFNIKNNNSSIFVARDYLKNSYICSSDNYFRNNPFEKEVDDSYYSAIYIDGQTDEWCITEEHGYIKDVNIGGRDSWIMLGHVFWSNTFSKKFISILEREYNYPSTKDKLWESIYIEHIDELKLKLRKYPSDFIVEFDTLDELRQFDEIYINDTKSSILKKCALNLGIEEREISNISPIKSKNNIAIGFSFFAGKKFEYYYESQNIERK